MDQITFACLSIESSKIDTSNAYTSGDTVLVDHANLDKDTNYTDVYQFQAPKQVEIVHAKNAKLCQISPVNRNGPKNPGEAETTCHSRNFDNGNSVGSDTTRIMGANHSYSLKSRQDMRKNGEEKFSSTDELCFRPEISDPIPQGDFNTMSKREMASIPASTGTKENGQFSYAYSEAKCNTTPRNRVRLGDYTEPADATNFTWGHKSRKPDNSSEVYSDPYEPRRLSDNLKQSPSWKRRLHPGGGVVYELAQTPEVIYDHPPSRSEETEEEDEEADDYDKLDRNRSRSSGDKKKNKLPDNYDHVPSKLEPEIKNDDDYLLAQPIGCDQKQLFKNQESATYNLNKSSEVKSIETSERRPSQPSENRPLQPLPIKNGHMDDPSIYEEPWDSQVKQMELQKKIQRAHSRTEDHTKITSQLSTPSSSSSSSLGDKLNSPETKITIRSPSNNSANFYEDAWDSPKRQQQLQEQLRMAHSVSNSSSSSNTYEDAWDTPERLSQVHQKIQRAMSHEGPAKPRPAVTEMETYAEPWDTAARQKELQDKLQASHIRAQRKQSGGSLSAHSTSSQLSVGSSGSPSSPTRRNMYPDYRTEDIMDHSRSKGRRSSSTKSTQSMSPSSGGSPTHRNRQQCCTFGERINPLIPVDSQSWYHGNISRQDAENILRVCKEGSFLVRDSESDRGQKSLSLKSFRMNIHVKIILKVSGTYILGENSRDFNSIPEMIDYYTCHLLPLKGAEHITLLHPVDCKWAEQKH